MKTSFRAFHTVRVLVVDDSAFARRTLTNILDRDPRINVIGTAWDGQEAIEKIATLSPDVVTMDINMPHMNGLEALKIIMRDMPTPVIIVTWLKQNIIEKTLEALEYGAVDCILKPTELASDKLFQIKSDLVNKVVAVAGLDGPMLQNAIQQPRLSSPMLRRTAIRPKASPAKIDCIAIGVSTGGPTALYHIIPTLPKDFPCGIIIVQHMPPGFTKSLAERMNKNSAITVKEAESGDRVQAGLALIAPGGYHLFLEQTAQGHVVAQVRAEPSHYIHIPSIDLTFCDVAEIYRQRCVGIILTGMGKDGVKGLEQIKKYGGCSIAEDKSSCVVFGMPEVAIRRGLVDNVASVHEIAGILMKMI
ncbi:chemotaxis response regulator protein-glutamate methylesterase [candidate division KSB3 bacterium]|uniref:Protein-glutamate methylesterase/protein-glutamine glutaminase n=1 Tax=candidate division KSB3 bacterium TaxID=2044937 RepID=A0A2G6EAQ7_9BACT|nr:MAG: chemotaxis response regulator protein-glutamate methylesterase [candidate division KSB3 bacterium]PIE30899.1 MAG: chemotaxis response regulator protein-glutamate methylesterase [candidate division KSB3 bacterium]